MGKWTCKCGQSMNDHKYPDENCYRVYSEHTWDTIPCDENGYANLLEDIPVPTYCVYKCPNCGRLMCFEDGNECTFYLREK